MSSLKLIADQNFPLFSKEDKDFFANSNPFFGLPIQLPKGKELYFVSGIDTEVGKSICTGFIAKKLKEKNLSVTTMKFIQTGCSDTSDDIIRHRSIMNSTFDELDKSGITAPAILEFPSSPALAQKVAGKLISFQNIVKAIYKVLETFDIVLLEGAGGLMVPLTNSVVTLDWVAKAQIPLILVTGGKLGSVNHTILSLEEIKKRNITLSALVYNEYGASNSKTIFSDTKKTIGKYVTKNFSDVAFLTVPAIEVSEKVLDLPLYK